MMSKNYKTPFFFLVFLSLLFQSSFLIADGGKKAVTYQFSGGRFGDNLLSYLHAKWISYKYDIPVIYQPFLYSDQLHLHAEGLKTNEMCSQWHFEASHVLREGSLVNEHDPRSVYYVCEYFPESEDERANYLNAFGRRFAYFTVDWDDEGFHREIQRVVQPINKFTYPPLPPGRISVAIHIRSGIGFDGDKMHLIIPLKFPLPDYYLEQLKAIYHLFREQPLYVYIFSDDPNPKQFVDFFHENLPNADIEYGYRKKDNNHYTNILEDFFAMLQFQCLIRSQSNFSVVAGKVGDFLVEIGPITYVKKGEIPAIDQVEVKIKKNIIN